MSKSTFKGQVWRVQITVFDFKTNPIAAGPHAGHIYFSVSCLPVKAHPSTAFSIAGDALYHGEDLNEALRIAERKLGFRPHLKGSTGPMSIEGIK